MSYFVVLMASLQLVFFPFTDTPHDFQSVGKGVGGILFLCNTCEATKERVRSFS